MWRTSPERFATAMSRPHRVQLFALKSVVTPILSISLAASSMFLHQWNEALTAFSSIVNADPGTGKIEIVSEDQSRTLLDSRYSIFGSREVRRPLAKPSEKADAMLMHFLGPKVC